MQSVLWFTSNLTNKYMFYFCIISFADQLKCKLYVRKGETRNKTLVQPGAMR